MEPAELQRELQLAEKLNSKLWSVAPRSESPEDVASQPGGVALLAAYTAVGLFGTTGFGTTGEEDWARGCGEGRPGRW